MAFKRGDIVKIYFKLPHDNKQEAHPGLIISNEDVFLDDECYIMVMLTGSEEFDDLYSYPITDQMLNKPLPKRSQVRCHIIAHVLPIYIVESKILATMKQSYVDLVVQRINDNVLTEQ